MPGGQLISGAKSQPACLLIRRLSRQRPAKAVVWSTHRKKLWGWEGGREGHRARL